jgi:cystathionine gamma-synthase
MLFASGSTAAAAVFQSLLPGDHVVVSRILYWGVRRWLAEFGIAWGLDVEFVDTSDAAAVRAAIRPGRTRLLWLETPANPTWDIVDLAAVIEIARAADVRVAVDNTVSTPGCVVGPFEAWLLLRGMRTLFLRVRRASDTALGLARHFERHPALAAVLYPGLPSHPGHDVAMRQMTGGFGGMYPPTCYACPSEWKRPRTSPPISSERSTARAATPPSRRHLSWRRRRWDTPQ